MNESMVCNINRKRKLTELKINCIKIHPFSNYIMFTMIFLFILLCSVLVMWTVRRKKITLCTICFQFARIIRLLR